MSALHENPDNPAVVHEESDVNVSAILKWGAGLLVVTAVVYAFLYGLIRFANHPAERSELLQFPMGVERQNTLPPEPRLQNTPQLDMLQLRAGQDALLHGYGWVNKEAGVARIPIDEAMRIVVRRGLPARETAK